MDFVLLDRSRFEHEYNCSFFDVDSIPLVERRHMVLGALCIVLFFVFEFLYIPCLYAISKLQIEKAVGKLMFILGLSDTCGLIASGFFAGYFTITGTVYCSSPRLMLTVDLFAMFCWGAGSFTNVLLAFNRCIQVHNPWLAKTLFDGRAIWGWIGVVCLYGLTGMLGSKPIFFNSIYMIGFFNPFEGYYPDHNGTYHNYLHTLNNFFVVFGIITMYALFFVGLLIRRRNGAEGGKLQMRRAERQTFYQIAIIAILEMTTCLVYIYIQFFRTNQLVYYIGTFTFLFRQGTPSVVYLVGNRRIRNILREVCGLRPVAIKAYTTTNSMIGMPRTKLERDGSTN